MKFGILKSIAHNIAHSLASGVGLPLGVYFTYIFDEAASQEDGNITVDFLTGQAVEAGISHALKEAIRRYSEFLCELCKEHGTDLNAFKTLTVIFYTHPKYGEQFTVTIEDQKGRKSVDQYSGFGGARLKRSD